MAKSIRDSLKAVVKDVRSFGDAVSAFPQEFPEIFEDALLRQSMNDFTSAYAETLQALENPELRIATFGTTSSGKSTLLNALIGRRIAPVDSGEMSGGVLEISDADDRLLRVGSFGENPSWETGEWRNVSDVSAYDRIRNQVMREYQAVRKQAANQQAAPPQADRPVTFPQIAYSGPILPVRDPSLLGTPEDFQLKFVDLPGLNRVNDRDNLSVVQKYVKGAFCLVVLDYAHTDDASRQKLLEELRDTIKSFGGEPESMIFILNRVDQRSGDDEPLDRRLNILRREIQDTLKLREEPDIIPFEARLLYNAQVAWGAAGGNIPQASAELRREHLTRMFDECASTLRRQHKQDRGLRVWLDKLSDHLEEEEDPSPDDMQRLLAYARDWSGGTMLWDTLRARLTQSLDRLLIIPALSDLFNAYELLSAQLEYISAQKKSEIEIINQELDHLKSTQQKLNQVVEARRRKTEQDLSGIVQNLRNNNDAAAIEVLKNMGDAGQELSSVKDVIDTIHANLMQKVIRNLRSGLDGEKSVLELEKSLKPVLPPHITSFSVNAVDKYRMHLGKLSANRKEKEKQYIIELPADDANRQTLEELERRLRAINEGAHNAFVARARFELQAHTDDIFTGLREILKHQSQEMEQFLEEEVADERLLYVVKNTYRTLVRNDFRGLESGLFESTVHVKADNVTRREKIGEEERVIQKGNAGKGLFWGMLLGGAVALATGGAAAPFIPLIAGAAGGGVGQVIKSEKRVKEDVYDDVSYLSLAIPTEHALGDAWAQSVKSGLDALWEPLLAWLQETLSDAQDSFSSAMSEVIATMDRIADEKSKSKEEDRARVSALWEKFDHHTELSARMFDTFVQDYGLYTLGEG